MEETMKSNVYATHTYSLSTRRLKVTCSHTVVGSPRNYNRVDYLPGTS